jgi:protocatechuate 3,4-dioxygenase beta subunit
MSSQLKDARRRMFLAASAVGIGTLAHAADKTESDQSVANALFEDNGVPYIGITEDGPLYPPGDIPWLSDLTAATRGSEARAIGQTLYLFGRILDRGGRPLENATMEIWQTDHNGTYLHPRGWDQDKLDPNFGYFAKVRTNDEGFYFFKTIRPRWHALFGALPRAAHIHMKMRHLDHGVLTTEAYFQNASHAEIAPTDKVFLNRPGWVRNRIVLEEQAPGKFPHLDVTFEGDAICCNYDLAFLL